MPRRQIYTRGGEMALDELVTPAKKKRGRPPKPKPDISMSFEPQQTTEVTSKEKRIYDIMSIFRRLEGVHRFYDIKVRNYTWDDIERFLDKALSFGCTLWSIP